MAANLRKYKYNRPSNTRPTAPSVQSSSADQEHAPNPPRMDSEEMGTEDLKSQILLSLKEDISAVISAELKNSLAEDFNYLKNKFQAVRTELANNVALAQYELNQMKAAIKDMEGSISTWSD
ncbi:hypothetical protein ABVT39_023336 [Epinephelus coioides]